MPNFPILTHAGRKSIPAEQHQRVQVVERFDRRAKPSGSTDRFLLAGGINVVHIVVVQDGQLAVAVVAGRRAVHAAVSVCCSLIHRYALLNQCSRVEVPQVRCSGGLKLCYGSLACFPYFHRCLRGEEIGKLRKEVSFLFSFLLTWW